MVEQSLLNIPTFILEKLDINVRVVLSQTLKMEGQKIANDGIAGCQSQSTPHAIIIHWHAPYGIIHGL